jgi:hypothetical protein
MTEPIILTENPDAGVNPHLNSELQTPGNVKTGQLSIWPSFHSNYLGDITLQSSIVFRARSAAIISRSALPKLY